MIVKAEQHVGRTPPASATAAVDDAATTLAEQNDTHHFRKVTV